MLRKTIQPLLFSLCVALPTACVTHKKESPEDIHTDDSLTSDDPREVEPSEIEESVDREIGDSHSIAGAEIGTEDDEINQVLKNGIPIEINDKVNEWISYFSKKNSDAFQRFLDRGEPYKNMIAATLRDHGIPSEIYYLAMIESGFVLHAKSSASAVGFWQFMPATGRRYGLRVDKYVDERRDPWRATVAASMYLSDLNNVFDSWYLAMAAYNAGEMRIMNAIMRGKSREFWTLVKGKQLPTETMDYIPKVLAAFMIGSNPEKYGFRVPKAEAHDAVTLATVPSPIALSKVAEVSGVPLDTLQQFNPHLKTGITPPGSGSYKIWVPTQYKNSIASVQGDLQNLKLHLKAVSPAFAVNDLVGKRKFHRVRRGENLASIAQNYGLTVASLMELNNLRSSRVFSGKKLRIQADGNASSTPAGNPGNEPRTATTQNPTEWRKANALAALKGDKKTELTEAEDATYRVQRGDNLRSIARRFRLPINELKKMNRLRRTQLQIGQVLIVSKDRADQT